MSSKIAIAGDLHLGGALSRHKALLSDYMRAARLLVEAARREGAASLILPGDVMDAPAANGGVCAAMKTLVDGFDQVFFVEGNHDLQADGDPHPMEALGATALREGAPVETRDGVVLAGWGYKLRQKFKESVAETMADVAADILVVHQSERALQGFAPDFDRRDVALESGWIVCGHTHVCDLDPTNRFLSPGVLHPQNIEQTGGAGAVYLYDPSTREIAKAASGVPFRKVVRARVGCDGDLDVLRRSVAAAHVDGYGAPYVVLEMLPKAPFDEAFEIVRECPHRIDRRGLVLDDAGCGDAFATGDMGVGAADRMIMGLERELRDDEADIGELAADLIRNSAESRLEVLRRETGGVRGWNADGRDVKRGGRGGFA